jgi:hypothetical protein
MPRTSTINPSTVSPERFVEVTKAQATTTTFEGQRISITTSRSFDDVLATLRQLIGTDSWSSMPAAMQELDGANQANFETSVRNKLGPSEFMFFHEINHSQWLPIYGIKRRVLRLIFGNPIIAFTMLRDDLTAGLFAPVEGDDGNGCTMVYVLPSSVMTAANPSLLPAARQLDRKLDALISGATGVASLSATNPSMSRTA